MSMKPQPIPPIPEMTVQVARAAFKKGNPYMQMRDELGTFFTDDQFMQLYPADGQPAYSPWRLALICVMQFAENLTDRQAADAVRSRIDWKYALSLELTDEGFDYSVLSEFRQRLVQQQASEQLLDQMLHQLQAMGLLEAGGTQRTDATHVIADVRELQFVEIVGLTLQHALDNIARTAPEWLQRWAVPDWYDRYGQPLTEFRLPRSKTERRALAQRIGEDGAHLLEQVYHDPTTPATVRMLDAVNTLRQVWLQRFKWVNNTPQLRDRKEMPPASTLIQSPFDLSARYSHKRTMAWVGYKAHLTETCNAYTPNLITHVLTTPAPQADVTVTAQVHAGLARRACLPDVHLVDKAYTSGQLLVDSRQNYGIALVGPVTENESWQHKTGYDHRNFHIDWEQERVTCPQGKQSQLWMVSTRRDGLPLIYARFRQKDCQPCPARELCTRARMRTLSFREQPYFEAVEQRKQEQHTEEFREIYAQRAGVEGTISQSVFALGMRRSRYRSLEKTHLQATFTALAINVQRALNWLNEKPKAQTRLTRFGKLRASATAA